MKGITAFIKLEKSIALWATNQFGNPIRFIKKSPLNTMMRQLCTVRPRTIPPQLYPRAGEVAIVIPDDAYRKPERYNYLSAHAAHEMAMAITDLFELAIWKACAPHIGTAGLQEAVRRWCDSVSITAEHHEAVVQRFYRIRKRFEAQGVVLGRRNGVRKSTQLNNYCKK